MNRAGKQVWLVTGGAGFIGANFVHLTRGEQLAQVVNLDKLTYAGNPTSLAALKADPEYVFVHGDIGDKTLVGELLTRHRPQTIVNFAAESHVDRSIVGPAACVETNVVGTFNLLEAVLTHWKSLPAEEQAAFRFLQVSTDEVYGSLAPDDPPFTESTPNAPNSPYAASKAAADHFVRAYHHTYGLPVLTTNCSNNYGPYQFPEKLIPLVITRAVEGKPLPVYGDGRQVRDWLFVDDHCRAIQLVLERGQPGETYNIGGRSELANMEVVQTICHHLDELLPESSYRPHKQLITHVADRPGHDRRYSIDESKIRTQFGWSPRETFSSGIAKTIRWYLEHADWVERVRSKDYQQWLHTNYDQRAELKG